MPYSYEFPNYSPPPKIGADNLLQLYEHVSMQYSGLLNKMDQLQSAMQGYYQYANDAVAKLDVKTQAALDNLRNIIDINYKQLKQEIDALSRYAQSEITALQFAIKDAIDSQFLIIEQDFAQWKSGVDDRITGINLQFSAIYNRLHALEMERQRIFKLDAPVTSPFTLDTMECQDCIDQISMWLNTDALSVGQLARASWVHAGTLSGWTVRDLMTITRRKANKRGYNKYMRNPFDGKWTRIKYVVNATINRTLPGSMNITALSNLGLTCAQVKTAHLTAYDMLTDNKKLMEVDRRGN